MSIPNTTYTQWAAGSWGLLYRGAYDSYITSNCYYSASNEWVARYSLSNNGIGVMHMGGGVITWDSYNGTVSAGGDYAISPRFKVDNAGNFIVGAGCATAEANNTTTISAGQTIVVNYHATSTKNIMEFALNGSGEGTIATNAAGTISYNTFLGSHNSSLTDNSEPDIKRGTVVSTIDALHQTVSSSYGNRLAKFKISDTENDTRVYGVFGWWGVANPSGSDSHEATINGLGASLIRVTGSCAGGDLLVSAGDGCAKVNNSGTLQTVIGKVTANTSGSATEDRLIPCVLYCG